MRLIDANALREAILEERKHIREEEYKIKRGFMLGGLRRALRCLEEAPTVERPRGEREEEILEIIEHTKRRMGAVNGLYADGALTKDHAIECKIKILDLLLKELEDEIDYQAVIPKEVTE